MSNNDTKLNGSSPPPRKLLSDQLDRLDGIIDALDAGLGVVVADAVKKAADAAARQTAEAVARETLTNTEAPRAAPPFLIERGRLACLFLWRHRLPACVSLSAGLASFTVSYLVGPTASSLALAALGAAFACRPARLWAWLTGRAS